jgi:hypothetical protein
MTSASLALRRARRLMNACEPLRFWDIKAGVSLVIWAWNRNGGETRYPQALAVAASLALDGQPARWPSDRCRHPAVMRSWTRRTKFRGDWFCGACGEIRPARPKRKARRK